MIITLPLSVLSVGKRRRTPVASGGGSTPHTRSGSVKRETTPVSKSSLSPQPQQLTKLVKPGAASSGGKKRTLATVRRRIGNTNASLAMQDLGCHEEITMEEEDDDEDEEEEGECSATQCLQPVADQIIWVQCDHCHEWFHCVCVGLTKEYAEQIDTYKCAACKQGPTAIPVTSAVDMALVSRPTTKVGTLLSSFSSSSSPTSSSISPGQT